MAIISKKKGQMQLSFGMIFSIILIVAFLAFAIFAIIKFLGTSEDIQILDFKDQVIEDVDKLWKGSQGSQEREYFLPKEIKEVCIVDFSSHLSSEKYKDFQLISYGTENLAFYPVGSASGLDSTNIKNIDVEEITSDRNPKCFEAIKGKVKITISKEYGENLVMLA